MILISREQPTELAPEDFGERVRAALLEWSDAEIGDVIVDRLIGVLQKAFPGSTVNGWEIVLADFRSELAAKFRGLVTVDLAAKAAILALEQED
jgi:hypothetical protein